MVFLKGGIKMNGKKEQVVEQRFASSIINYYNQIDKF